MFSIQLENETLHNKYYRNVIFTSTNMQLVLMNLPVNTNISKEIHKDHDQFIKIEEGICKVITPDKISILNAGDAVIIIAGTQHEVINIGSINLKLYTIYTPPEHKAGLIQEYNDNKIEQVQNGGSIMLLCFLPQ